jgi:hypothetical protein
MSCKRVSIGGVPAIVCDSEHDNDEVPPAGYIARQEWAERQYKAGNRQRTCGICGKWYFPCEMSDRVITGQALQIGGGSIKSVVTSSPAVQGVQQQAARRGTEGRMR